MDSNKKTNDPIMNTSIQNTGAASKNLTFSFSEKMEFEDSYFLAALDPITGQPLPGDVPTEVHSDAFRSHVPAQSFQNAVSFSTSFSPQSKELGNLNVPSSLSVLSDFDIKSVKDGTLLFPLDDLGFRVFSINFAASTSNRPPVVDNDVINALSPQAVGVTEVDFESNMFTLDAGPAFSDPDIGDVLTYSAVFSGTLSDGTVLFGATPLSTIGLMIDPSTGIISGVAAPNVDSGDYQIVVTATDLSGASVTADPITLNIGHVENYGNNYANVNVGNGLDPDVTTFSGYDDLTFGTQAGALGGSVVVNTAAGKDTISFGGFAGALLGSVVVNAGNGADMISFENNAGLFGSVVVNAGNGDDKITFGIEAATGASISFEVDAGKGDDKITFADSAAIFLSGSFKVDAGDGDDKLNFGSRAGDSMTSTGSFIVNAGNGDDTIDFDLEATRKSSGSFEVDAGDGDDTLNFGDNTGINSTASSIFNVKSGSGDDKITFGIGAADSSSGFFTVDAGDGDDTLNFGNFTGANSAASSIFNVKSGSGDDKITFGIQTATGASGSFEVDAGDGDDTITFGENLEMFNAVSLIDGGDGFDTLILDTSSGVTFGDVFSGGNVTGIEKLQLTAAALNQFVMNSVPLEFDEAQVVATSDTTNLIIDQVGAAVDGQLNLNLLTDWTRVGLATPANGTPGEMYTLYTAGAASLYLDQAIGIIENFGDNYSLGLANTVTTDAGNDGLTFGNGAGADSGFMTVDAGDGTDMISFGNFAGSDGSVIVNAGEGVDTISFEKAAGFFSGSVIVNAGSGGDQISFGDDAGDTGSVVVNAGDGADMISFGIQAGLNSGIAVVNAGNGADMISFGDDAGSNGTVVVDAGDDNDTITFGENLEMLNASSLIDGGDGFDTLTLDTSTGVNFGDVLSGGNVTGIEKLILSDGALSQLNLSAQNLLDMSDNDILIIDLDVNDLDGMGALNAAQLTGLTASGGIVDGSTIPNGVAGESYQLYDGTIGVDLAQLYINTDIVVAPAPLN